MDLVYILLVGGIAGWLAGLIVKGSGFGILGNIVVGILGALFGGLVFPLLGIGAVTAVGRILLATGGAVILLFLLGTFGRRRSRAA